MIIQPVVAIECVVPSNPGTMGADYGHARAATTTCDNNERGNCENKRRHTAAPCRRFILQVLVSGNSQCVSNDSPNLDYHCSTPPLTPNFESHATVSICSCTTNLTCNLRLIRLVRFSCDWRSDAILLPPAADSVSMYMSLEIQSVSPTIHQTRMHIIAAPHH